MVKIEQFELRTPQLVSMRLPRAGTIRVNAGRLWLTQDGRADDVWLGARESWTASEGATVWLSAEPSADFQIARPAPVSKAWPGLRPRTVPVSKLALA